MVEVEQPQRHARRSMDGGMRAVDASKVGVMATAETSRAPVAVGQLNQSEKMTNECTKCTFYRIIDALMQDMSQNSSFFPTMPSGAHQRQSMWLPTIEDSF